ncbi:hypothetical protein ACN47E_003745 [Coniothyrium glycines]
MFFAMDNPVKDIPRVVHLLTQSPPSIQRATIDSYFTPDASFTHPFCRTGKWPNSRLLVAFIYRWYKIMSPTIDITVQSVAFDETNLILYASVFQIFRIWWIPCYYAPVHLTCVLRLEQNPRDGKYYIKAQDDLYAVDQWIRFLLPGGWVLVYMYQFWATVFCVLGVVVLRPVSWAEERYGFGEGMGKGGIEWERRKKSWEMMDERTADEVVENTELRGRILG